MFTEARYYAEFKKLRNRFRKYRYHDLIGGAIAYINAPAKDKIESMMRHPWIVMLFVKWIFLDDKYPNTNGKAATKNEVYGLLQLAYELSSKLRMPNEYEHYTLFFRNTAFQQFLYQIDFHYAHLSRQSILFSSLDKNHYIYREFLKHTGIEVQDFLDLSLITLARFLDTQESVIPEKWFSTVYARYPANKIKCYLNSISKDIDSTRQALLEQDDGKRPAAEHYEVTPFIDFPLIKVSGGYALTHRNILFRRLEHYVYDVVKSINPEKFMNKFGEMFERYVEQSLRYSEALFFTESDMEGLIGATGNQIDFLIQDAGCNIFVDAKAVEMSARGKTTHSTEILRHQTKSSILKAIKQAHDVIRQVADHNTNELAARKYNYLLVVTFKELYLGSGTTYYEVIAKDKVDEIYEEYKDYSCIPPENIFFITIDDLDMLADILKQKKQSLVDILEFYKNNDKNPTTRKFVFTQHIRSLEVTSHAPDYLVDERDAMFERILESANGNKKAYQDTHS